MRTRAWCREIAVLVLVLGGAVGALAQPAASRTRQHPVLGPTIHVSGYPVAIANGRIVMGENYTGRILTYATTRGRRRSVHIPHMFSLLAASGDTAWIDAGTKSDDRDAIEQVNVTTGAVLGSIDLGALVEPDIRAPLNQVVVTNGGVWLLTFDELSALCHLLRLDPATTTIAARQDLPSGFDSLAVAGSNVWVSGQDSGAFHSLLRAFDPTTLAAGPEQSFDIQSVDAWGIVGNEHSLWAADGQRLFAFDAATGRVIQRIALAHVLAPDTHVDAIAPRSEVVWIAVSRKLHDDATPPDHVELIALRASDGHVLSRSPIPGGGEDVSFPQLVTGDGEIWVWLGDDMEKIVATPH